MVVSIEVRLEVEQQGVRWPVYFVEDLGYDNVLPFLCIKPCLINLRYALSYCLNVMSPCAYLSRKFCSSRVVLCGLYQHPLTLIIYLCESIWYGPASKVLTV